MTAGLTDAIAPTPAGFSDMYSVRSTSLRPIYMDHQAATPMDQRVVEVVVKAMTETFGNASNATHAYGQAASLVLEDAREAVAALVGSSASNVRFTSGSTEAAALAFRIASLKKVSDGPLRIVTSRVEHKAVLEPIQAMVEADKATVAWIDVDDVAQISLPSLAGALTNGADLVCMMAANNEVGTIYPLEVIAEMVHRAGAELLVDATQGAGRIEIRSDDWTIDYLVLNAHKLYGPKGIGALVGNDVRSTIADKAAGHAGTANVPAAAGFGEACRIASREGAADERRISGLRDEMQAILCWPAPIRWSGSNLMHGRFGDHG
ncbi:aminotransferase class V-fold PLP-dependent enzyme [Aureimonas sp. ME7]|uniref:cysteine desulfurase family protein n=1 Tax=Aureimonas sp. ME7 TaxID=2744252 RepID=UPI0015FA501C|nr:aminotransferase class V-fold PLP-dependent enzyme [Aureimonas sp. ME7]